MSREVRSVLFADICDSTRLFEQWGDEPARGAIRSLLLRCAQQAEGLGGRVIKVVGDELMAAFPEAGHAAAAACAMQRETQAAEELPGLCLRIGLHHGEVLIEQGDLFGTTVNTAARMVAVAHRGQIIASAAVLAAASGSAERLRARSLGASHLPGLRHAVEMWEILWQDSDSTTRVRAVPPLAQAVTDSTLHLQLAAREIVLDEHSLPLQLGRDRHAGLVVEAQWVSRQHAQIEYRRGFFLLTDVSTNGTYVTLPGGDTVVLHRNQLPLRGAGTISLGREPELNSGLLVRYQCR